jgi:hypothetical protein
MLICIYKPRSILLARHYFVHGWSLVIISPVSEDDPLFSLFWTEKIIIAICQDGFRTQRHALIYVLICQLQKGFNDALYD